MSSHHRIPARAGKDRLCVGIGYEAERYRYQDKNHTVTCEHTRCGLWGMGECKVLHSLVGFLTAVWRWITKPAIPF